MKVQAFKCLNCYDVVYSRARHDFRWCSCKSLAVDGGTNYHKVTGNPDNFIPVELKVDANEQQLYDDWNNGWNRFGVIPFSF